MSAETHSQSKFCLESYIELIAAKPVYYKSYYERFCSSKDFVYSSRKRKNSGRQGETAVLTICNKLCSCFEEYVELYTLTGLYERIVEIAGKRTEDVYAVKESWSK